MLRFLRRYNRIILVVGGSILMVLFLLPSTATQMSGNIMSQAVATMDGRKVTFADLRRAGDQAGLAASVVPEIMYITGFREPQRPQPERWLLLAHEARQAGLIGDAQDGASFLGQAAPYAADVWRMEQSGRPETDPAVMLQTLQARYASARAQRGGPELDIALATMRGILRLIQLSSTRSMLSTRDLIAAGHRTLDTAAFGAVLIEASSIVDQIPEPSEGRIAAHFEAYKGIDPTADPHGIGYLRPPAVDIEYLRIDRALMAQGIQLDPVEVSKFWRQNRERFPGDFPSSKAQVEDASRGQRLTQLFEQAEKTVRQQIFRSVQSLATVGNYRVLPADWDSKRPSFSALAEAVDAELKRVVPGDRTFVTAVNDAQWRTREGLQSVPGLGSVIVNMGDRGSARFPDYAMAVRELAGENAAGVQQGLIYGPMSDFAGNMYYFRINATRAQSPAPAMDDIRSVVVRDLKTLDAMDRLRAESELFRQRAVADGLEAAPPAPSMGAERARPRWDLEATSDAIIKAAGGPGGGSPDPQFNHAALRDAIIAAASKLDPKVSASTVDTESRTIALVVPEARGLVVAQVIRWRPMTIDAFSKSIPMIEGAARRAVDVDLGPMFSFESLSKRHSFTRKGGSSEDEEGATKPADSGAPKTDDQGAQKAAPSAG